MKHVHETIVAVKKAVNIIYFTVWVDVSECVHERECVNVNVHVALITQHVKRVRLFIFLSVALPVPPLFSTLSHKL